MEKHAYCIIAHNKPNFLDFLIKTIDELSIC